MKPYWSEDGITIYHGDCREILPSISSVDTIITDPVWPNSSPHLIGHDRPMELLQEALDAAPPTERLILHLGGDSDPRILRAVPEKYKFLQIGYLRYACPSRKGRCLYGGDIAYIFGEYPPSSPGLMVISMEYCSTKPKDFSRHIYADNAHPCPRRLQHVRWLTARWARGIVLDPFAGSGTTLLAAKLNHVPAIGIEIEERFIEIAIKRLGQKNLDFTETEESHALQLSTTA